MKIKIEKALGEIARQMVLSNNNVVNFIKEQPDAKIVLNFLDETAVYEYRMSAHQAKLDYENGVSFTKPDTWDIIFDSLYMSECALDVGFYVGDRLVRTYFIVGYRPICSTFDGCWVPVELYFIDWASGTTIKRMRKYTYPLSSDAYKFINIAMLGWLNTFLRMYLSNPSVEEKLYDFRAKLFWEGDKVGYGFDYCRLIG